MQQIRYAPIACSPCGAKVALFVSPAEGCQKESCRGAGGMAWLSQGPARTFG